MTEPERLSQGVMIASEEPGPPMPTGPEWDRWERLARMLQVARRLQVVAVPRSVDDLYCVALGTRKDARPAPSMAPIKRELVRLREEIAWTLRTAGYSQVRIAGELGVSQPAVCKILRRVERRVLALLRDEIQAVKVKQAAQLEYITDQAMRAWKASQERIEERTSTATDLVGRERCVRRNVERRGPGDPRFLAVALKALAAERELWGLTRPANPEPDPAATIRVTRSESLTVRQPCGAPGRCRPDRR